jgi:MraZ protein
VLFTGQSEQLIDAKGRLAVPARFRAQWSPERDGQTWFCLPWPTGHLRIYTQATFEALSANYANSLTPDENVAEVESQVFGWAEPITPDAELRLTLPKRHIEMIALPKDVCVVGVRNRMEVHPLELWKQRALASFKGLPDKIARIESPSKPRP